MGQVQVDPAGNFLAGLAGGVQMGNTMRQTNDQNALRELMSTADINDPSVQQKIMGYDPQVGVQLQNQTYQRGREAAADGRAEQTFEMRLKEHALTLSAAERAQQAAGIRTAVTPAVVAYRQGPDAFRAYVTQNAAEIAQTLQAVGIDPTQLTYESVPQALAKIEGIADVFEQAGTMVPDAPKPADEYQRYVQETIAAGQQPLNRIDYAQAKRGKGTVVYDPTTGKPLVSIGGGNSDPTDVTKPSSPAAMVSTIDGILSDPALDKSTGALAWTQAIPGTDQRRFGTRVKQLDGQAFLQAFESLKGGGQITEIEGDKATQAIGRLDSAQSPEDYRQALTDLRDVLSLAAKRPVGWAQQQSAKPQDMPSISDEAGYNALPSGTVFIAPDGTQRRKP